MADKTVIIHTSGEAAGRDVAKALNARLAISDNVSPTDILFDGFSEEIDQDRANHAANRFAVGWSIKFL